MLAPFSIILKRFLCPQSLWRGGLKNKALHTYKIPKFSYLLLNTKNSSSKHTLTTINNNYLEIGIFHIIIVLEKLNNMEVYNKMVEYCKKLDDDTFAKAIDIFSKNHSLMCPIFEDDFNDFKKIVIKCKLQELVDLL